MMGMIGMTHTIRLDRVQSNFLMSASYSFTAAKRRFEVISSLQNSTAPSRE
jgi:hypothetical protein